MANELQRMRQRLEATSQIEKLTMLLSEDGKRYPRERKASALVIQDFYTVPAWHALGAKDQARVLKATAAGSPGTSGAITRPCRRNGSAWRQLLKLSS
jgi:hypothetical protein